MAAVYTGAGPPEQTDTAASPNHFRQHYCKAALPDMLIRGGEVLHGALDGSAVCFVTGTSHMLSGWGCFSLADAEI